MPTPLTQSIVNAATTKTRALIADGGFRGLYIDVRPNGKSYRFRFTDNTGQYRAVTIGDASFLKLQDARKLAKELARKAMMGEAVWEKTGRVKRSNAAGDGDKPAMSPAMTLAGFLNDRYIPVAKQMKRGFKTEESVLKNHILPDLGHRPFLEITKGELIQYLHGKLARLRPGTVNRILNGLKVIYSTALSWEVEGLVKNPLQGIKQFSDSSRRERFLTKDEAQKLLQAVLKSKNKMLAPIIAALLLTGCRKREVLDARWDCVDLERGILIVPISKNGKPRQVFLSEHAIKIFKQARAILRTEMGQEAAVACPWVFANPETGKPFTAIFKSWHAARTSVGLTDLRVHDLRHSFASSIVNSGGSLYSVQKLLGHSSPRMTERYAHLASGTLIQVATDVGNHFALSTLKDVQAMEG